MAYEHNVRVQLLHRWRVAPFALCVFVAGATLLYPFDGQAVGHLLVAFALLVIVIALAEVLPTESPWQILAPLLFVVLVAVLRDASGQTASGLSPLVALPILWVGLYGTRVQMVVIAVATGLAFAIPRLMYGASEYPAGDLRRAVLWTLIGVTIGPVVQGVVRRLREREQERAVAAERLEAVLRAATEHSIIATSPTGLITTFNGGAERMLGYTAAEAIDVLTLEQLHDPAELAERAQELGMRPGLEVLVDGALRDDPETREWTYIAKDGSRVPVRLTITANHGIDGEIAGFIGVASDVTAERHAIGELTVSEQRWRALLDHLPDTVVLTVGPDMKINLAMGAPLASLGLADIQGKSLSEAGSLENAARLEPVIQAALAGQEDSTEIRATHNGSINEVVAVPLPKHDGLPEALVLVRDVTESRLREQLLQDAKERFARLFSEAPNGVGVMTTSGVITHVNPALCAMMGRRAEDLVGRSADALGGGVKQLKDFLEALLSSPTGRYSQETRMRHTDGHLVDVAFDSILLRGVGGSPDEVLLNAVDVSERRRYEAQLAHLADHDPLTGLANRRRFDAELEAHLERCVRYGPSGAVLMLDLDHFKEVNDTLGHGAGDQLIVSVAEILRLRLRKSDVVARLGGDEFAILLPNADRASAERVAADVVRLVREKASFLDGSRPRRVTTSAGVVLIQQAEITASELLSTADLTMYDAKEAGRDRYAMLDTDDFGHPRASAQLAWADRITGALADERFVLQAQPVMDVKQGVIVGAEMLLRMIDDHGEIVLPGRFLYIAERLGLITQLDIWVSNQAINLLEEVGRLNPDFHVEVNLSGHSIGASELTEFLRRRIPEAEINPSRLIFEVRETAAVANIETAREFADQLANLGCRFALDNFGAGFGSFYYLKHLPFDVVKIDGEFIEKSPSNATDRSILASVVSIAHGMGKTTVAEFVASEEILTVCRELGVDLVQGYHVGRPAPLETVSTWAQQGRVFEI